jgi:hypothetical protein
VGQRVKRFDFTNIDDEEKEMQANHEEITSLSKTFFRLNTLFYLCLIGLYLFRNALTLHLSMVKHLISVGFVVTLFQVSYPFVSDLMIEGTFLKQLYLLKQQIPHIYIKDCSSITKLIPSKKLMLLQDYFIESKKLVGGIATQEFIPESGVRLFFRGTL